MTSYIRGFEDFVFSAQVRRRGARSSESEVNEAKDYADIPKDPIIYKGHYILVWPFRNEERHPDKKWGYTVCEDVEGKNYLAKSKGPVGNYEECCQEAQEIVDNLPTNSQAQ